MSNPTPKILAVDASTEACSVALLIDGELREDFRELPRAHTRFLLPMIDEMLSAANIKPAQLDAIAYTAGPGSFTGLRVGVATVQGLAFAAGVPVIGVSTLHCMAQAWADQYGHDRQGEAIIACLDARMDEVYCGEFIIGEQLCQPLREDRLCKPEQWDFSRTDYAAALGSGWVYAPRLATSPAIETLLPDWSPRASAVAQIALAAFLRGEAQSPEQAQAVYLRDSVAWK
ncbi:tRNA (adenosine(37)-N6)-threonylcarbamoyltransferase complex dimerization subunit type 1 TsaB [Spongiibacter sp. KMU-158]|uniref:tRNA threonylcarbamoyladenosine biosynthesis protein TsaB n=1 Tax=Spongiibacter pelagi TaxID=2760804 RepID=A0A927C219_9GAMM|nr:tRNA (adenosine(37)-N6)-threonylcarbamoyltransferase complex dimerization subunit type 1 TsaB [Spongiibacter pelagi]MBD2858592.1 tRNA (adenosine(37)-N6)-threonylcarbamoyltransferase complex dimerization subunit type 1 TsaB [Spongiibacter pelagi]